jgi:hypothetical protein
VLLLTEIAPPETIPGVTGQALPRRRARGQCDDLGWSARLAEAPGPGWKGDLRSPSALEDHQRRF